LFRGGFVAYEQLARDLLLWMKQDQHPESWFTTLVDFHKLPADFPGQSTLAPNLDTQARAAHFEGELASDIVERLDELPVSRRLIPYIQMHEFEALLFSDPSAFLAAYPGNQPLVDRLASIRAEFDSPEDIDDGSTTSPSKRILDILPGYQKPVAGILIARRIGLATIRRECRHFNDWLVRLIALAQESKE
jgi:uncharacterized protein DUF4276